MDYDRIFEQDKNRKIFYTDLPGRKMMVGKISLENAIARLNQDEYYTLVTYYEGDILPKEYMPLNNLKSDDGTLFATFKPEIRYLHYICRTDSIQMISRLPEKDSELARYLLGPGPGEVTLDELITEQYNAYMKSQNKEERPKKR